LPGACRLDRRNERHPAFFLPVRHQTLAVGRVMTPTLAMVVMRDAQIAAFKPEPFWTVQLKAGDIDRCPADGFRQNPTPRHFLDDSLSGCKGEVVVEAVETKEKLEKPPLLYDLTSLQRDANRILGFTAQQTLDSHPEPVREEAWSLTPAPTAGILPTICRRCCRSCSPLSTEKFKYNGRCAAWRAGPPCKSFQQQQGQLTIMPSS
jgi:hypothetical protein